MVVETAVAEYHLYKLETNNMSGIGVGTQVLMAGYDVGKISKIDVSYDPSLTFEVEMALKPEVLYPQVQLRNWALNLPVVASSTWFPPLTLMDF